MQKITTHLWFDKEAKEAAELYTSIFPNSRISKITTLQDTPSGSVDTVTFSLVGRDFQAISAGPVFKFNPSVSLHYLCKTKEEVDAIWGKLIDGGTALVELGEYPFSERFGWVQDKFGLSWQLFYSGAPNTEARITPVIMFVGSVCGKAEEAVNFWTSVFRDAKIDSIQRYGKGAEPNREGTVEYAAFSLFGQPFGAMDSAMEHNFGFNEAISFMVNCDTQDEIDYYWKNLSAVPEAEQCGWLKDKYGLSWQIVPASLEEMLTGDDANRIARVTQAFLVMKKLDIARLREAYEGR